MKFAYSSFLTTPVHCFEQYMRANKMKKNANSSANLAINASAQLHRITESAGSGVEIRNWSEYSQAEMGRDQAHSPINLTPANNNVFNLRGDAVEHAIPEQEVSDRSPLLAFGQRQPFGYNSVLSTAADRSAYRPATTTPGDDYSVGGWWELITAEVVVILVLYIVNKTGQELVISSIPLVTQAEFAWSREGGGYYMAAVGASVLPMILLINRFVRDSEERELVLNLSYACLVCLLVMLHFAVIGEYTVAQYVIGSALLFGFLNTLEGVIMALLARVISPELAKGTFNSGLLATEAGTFGRVVGDVCITVFGAGRHQDAVINQLFSPFLVLLVLSVGLVFYYYDRLL
jgi:predicted membrane protein